MTSGHTFHTPSFGDEDFELPPVNTASIESTYEMQNLITSQDNHIHIQQWSVGNPTQDNLTKGLVGSNEVLVIQSPTGQFHNERSTNSMEHNINSDESDDNFFKTSFKLQSDTSPIDLSSCQISDKRMKRDVNEPRKPVSAYALFFRDTQTAIKGQNPNASFGEVSKIVSSMWDALDPEHKNVYKKKAEIAKREYLKLLAAYRASAISKGDDVNVGGLSHLEGMNSKPAISKFNTPFNPTSVVKSIPTKPAMSTNPMQRFTNNENHTPQLLQCDQIEQQQTINSNQILSQGMLSDDTSAGLHQESVCTQGFTVLTNNSCNPSEMQKCIRNGCTNPAVINSDWEDEYCSNECVVSHCRDVFIQWVQTNNLQPESYTT